MMDILLTTIIKRPYVVLFLLAFLFLCVRQKGWKQTLLFLFSGYLIAWLSEACSIRTGFPYGWYYYVYENLEGEWLNWGVPVWDSVSYVFLSYAGLCVAEKIDFRGGETCIRPLSYASHGRTQVSPLQISLYAAFFTTLIDVIIDPVARMGDRWFLGKIYYYPDPGFYFDVPASNFAGWFLVSFCIVFVNLIFAKKFKEKNIISLLDRYGGLFLYLGIFIFNWVVAIYLKEWILVIADLLWILIPALFLKKHLASIPILFKKTP